MKGEMGRVSVMRGSGTCHGVFQGEGTGSQDSRGGGG